MRIAADQRTATPPSPETVDLDRTALLLDVDGTLLAIAATPDAVSVPLTLRSDLSDLLERLGGALALVSGRPIAALDRLFSPLAVPAIGGHGAEMRIAHDAPVLTRSPAELSPDLRRKVHRLAQIDADVIVEDKRYSISLHFRRAPQQGTLLNKGVREILSQEQEAAEEMEVLLGKRVIELKLKQFSKGIAVSELMTQRPFAGRTPLYFGDDTTDESVFAILPNLKGRGYSVGRAMPGAQMAFKSPQEVRTWLARIVRCRRATS
jgi:trehalose 6-phosphate phosphatase